MGASGHPGTTQTCVWSVHDLYLLLQKTTCLQHAPGSCSAPAPAVSLFFTGIAIPDMPGMRATAAAYKSGGCPTHIGRSEGGTWAVPAGS